MNINLKKDKMTKNERWQAILNRQPLDRVPVYAFAMGFSIVNNGMSVADYYNDPQKSYEAQMITADKFGFQDIPRIVYAGFGGWEFGGDVQWPTGEFAQAPSMLKYKVQTEEDVLTLKMPNIKTAGIIPALIEVAQKVAKSGSPYIWSFISGPFSFAGNISGLNKLARWLIKDPDSANYLLGMSVEFLTRLAKYWTDTFGASRIIADLGEPSTSNQVISPKRFEQYALPYITELNRRILDMGIKHICFHICGEQNANLPMWAKVPMGNPGIVSFGHEVDLELASKYFPRDIIMGNIEPALIQMGTQEEVYHAAMTCIMKGRKHPGGFMLALGCELPPRAKEDNVWAMMQAVSDFGWYD